MSPTSDLGVCAILIAEPNSLVATVDHERSSVRERIRGVTHCITGGRHDALANPFAADAMRIVKEFASYSLL
jgi:hypothetical protein